MRRLWIPISSPAPSPHAPNLLPAIPLQKQKNRCLSAKVRHATKVARSVRKVEASTVKVDLPKADLPKADLPRVKMAQSFQKIAFDQIPMVHFQANLPKEDPKIPPLASGHQARNLTVDRAPGRCRRSWQCWIRIKMA